METINILIFGIIFIIVFILYKIISKFLEKEELILKKIEGRRRMRSILLNEKVNKIIYYMI